MSSLARHAHRVAPCGIPLAWRHVSADRKRFAVAVAGVAFGVMLMLFQLGIYQSFLQMVVRPIEALNGDLVIVSRNYEYFYSARRFPERRVWQALADPAVAAARPLALSIASWRHPATGTDQQMVVFGIRPGQNPFRVPDLIAQESVCARPDGVLFDRLARPEFGVSAAGFGATGPFEAEINQHRVHVGGLFTLGATVAVSAHAVAGMEAFLRITGLPEHRASLGVLALTPGSDAVAAAARLSALLPGDVEVLPTAELARRERHYWGTRTPMGFITMAGMLIAMIVGAVVVYQVLYTDINDHLREYATLKAMGLSNGFFVGLVVREAAILLGIGFVPGAAIAAAAFAGARSVAGIPTYLTWSDTAAVVALAALMCLAAGLLATRRLRSADPADIFS